MDLEVHYDKLSSKDEAFSQVKEAITPELLEKFQVKAELSYKEDQIIAKGKGFELVLNFTDHSCQVNLTLSFLLKAFRSKITSALEKQIKRIV